MVKTVQCRQCNVQEWKWVLVGNRGKSDSNNKPIKVKWLQTSDNEEVVSRLVWGDSIVDCIESGEEERQKGWQKDGKGARLICTRTNFLGFLDWLWWTYFVSGENSPFAHVTGYGLASGTAYPVTSPSTHSSCM